jgi:hypothetical protein
MTASELERLCQMLRQCPTDGAEIAEARRHFSQRMLEDGMMRLTFTVTADEAAVVTAALDAAAETPNRRAEALVAIADERARGTSADRSPIDVSLRIEAGDLSGMTAAGAALPADTSGAYCAMPASRRSFVTRAARLSMSAARRERFPRRFAGR